MSNERELLTETSNLLADLEPILQRSISSLKEDLNPQTGMMRCLLQNEIEIQQEVLERVEEIQGRVSNFLNPGLPEFSDISGPLQVKMPDDEVICRRYASDTFVEVIEKIGIEKVEVLPIFIFGNPLVATYDNPSYTTRKSGAYYIIVHTSTPKKVEILEQIDKYLGIGLIAEDIRETS